MNFPNIIYIYNLAKEFKYERVLKLIDVNKFTLNIIISFFVFPLGNLTFFERILLF